MAEGEDKLTGFLTRKAGPLPIGVWIIAVGGGIAIAVYMRRTAGAGAEVPTEVDDQGFNQGGNTFTPGGVGGSAGTSNVNPLPTAPADNDEWLQRAADYLVGKGLSGSQVAHSLGKWLGGETLTQQDRAIVDMAIQAIGNPPTAPPPSPNAPPVPPTIPPRQVPPMPGTPGTAPRPTKPGPPVTPRLVSQAPNRATISVTSVRGATAYLWFLNGKQVNTTPSPMVTLTQLGRRTRYGVSVIPQNVAGNGPQSRALAFTTI